jgi:hypothetical protein
MKVFGKAQMTLAKLRNDFMMEGCVSGGVAIGKAVPESAKSLGRCVVSRDT